jgi:hypothetical protein
MIHFHVHKNRKLGTILNHMKPVYAISVFRIYLSFSQLHLSLPSDLFASVFLTKTCHLPWLDHPNNVSWGVRITKLPIMLFSPSSSCFDPTWAEIFPLVLSSCHRSRWPPRGLRRGLRLLASWDWGFECCREHGCLSLVSDVCCQVVWWRSVNSEDAWPISAVKP